MKKLIISVFFGFFLSLVPVFANTQSSKAHLDRTVFPHELPILLKSNNIHSFKDEASFNNGDIIEFDEGNKSVNNGDIIEFDEGNKSVSGQVLITYDLNKYDTNISLNCLNGVFTQINTDHINTKVLDATIIKGTDEQTQVKLVCKDSRIPLYRAKISLVKNIEKKDVFKNYNIGNKGKIQDTKAKNSFAVGKELDFQPSFVSILYFQTSIITDLAKSIQAKNENFNFEKLFKNNDISKKHSDWSKKLLNFDTKDKFIEAMTGGVSLKDIGISQDILSSLYNCANNATCNKTLDFSGKNISDKYDIYSMKEIENTLYKNASNIIDSAIKYYQTLNSSCQKAQNPSDVSDQIKNHYLDKLNSTNTNNKFEFELGYSIPGRIKNLQTIKNSIDSQGTNLLGMFNFYYELYKLQIGINNMANLCSPNKNKQEQIASFGKNMIKNISVNAIRSNSLGTNTLNDSQIVQTKTMIAAITPGNVVNQQVKSGKINLQDLQQVKNMGDGIGQIGNMMPFDTSKPDFLKNFK